MKSINIILVIFFSFLTIMFISCENTENIQPVRKTISINGNNLEIRNKIEEITQEINKAVLENDYETQLKYFTADAIIIPPLGPILEGKNAIKAGFDKNIKEKIVLYSFNAKIEELWVCGDRVYERGTWAMSQSTKRSKIPKAYYGSYFEIWKIQQDSTLLIDYIIYTLGFNPFEEQ
jgi:ketosteroid isomerase-like protein